MQSQRAPPTTEEELGWLQRGSHKPDTWVRLPPSVPRFNAQKLNGERPAVNRMAVGSTPTWAAKLPSRDSVSHAFAFDGDSHLGSRCRGSSMAEQPADNRQGVSSILTLGSMGCSSSGRKSGSHPESAGSIPAHPTNFEI